MRAARGDAEDNGGIAQSELGITDEQLQAFIASQMTTLFTSPFGEVDVKMLMADFPRDDDGEGSQAPLTYEFLSVPLPAS